jgi:hypothetical protein
VSHSGDSLFHGGPAKKHRARLPGFEEIDYHPHGLHALRIGLWRNAEKNHRQIARTLKVRGGHFSYPSFPERRNASSGGEPGVVLEVFNAVGESISVVTVKESDIEVLRADEVLAVRPLTPVG